MNVEIAQRLAELRRERGFSQEGLAEQLGLSRQAVSKWERAESAPDMGNLIALADLYEVTLDELLRVSPEVEEDMRFESQGRAESVETEAAAAAEAALAAAARAEAAAATAAEAPDVPKVVVEVSARCDVGRLPAACSVPWTGRCFRPRGAARVLAFHIRSAGPSATECGLWPRRAFVRFAGIAAEPGCLPFWLLPTGFHSAGILGAHCAATDAPIERSAAVVSLPASVRGHLPTCWLLLRLVASRLGDLPHHSLLLLGGERLGG